LSEVYFSFTLIFLQFPAGKTLPDFDTYFLTRLQYIEYQLFKNSGTPIWVSQQKKVLFLRHVCTQECPARDKILVEKWSFPDTACRRYAIFLVPEYKITLRTYGTGARELSVSTNITSLTGWCGQWMRMCDVRWKRKQPPYMKI